MGHGCRTTESFFPVCLPGYNPTAFLYAYVQYLNVSINSLRYICFCTSWTIWSYSLHSSLSVACYILCFTSSYILSIIIAPRISCWFHWLSILTIANLYVCGHWGGHNCDLHRLPRVSNEGYCCFCFWSVQSDTCLFLLTADPDGFFQLKECRYSQNPPCSFWGSQKFADFFGCEFFCDPSVHVCSLPSSKGILAWTLSIKFLFRLC